MGTAAATAMTETNAARLFDALDAIGVPAVILKGPVTRQRLYGRDEDRPVGDIDVLVPIRSRRRVDALLRGNGCTRIHQAGHADTWVGPAGPVVDVHVTLPYASVAPSRLWRALQRHLVTIEVAGRSMPALGVEAHVVHLAVHAVQSGLSSGHRSLDELGRAVALLQGAQGLVVAEVAAELGLTEVVATAMAAVEGRADDGHHLPVRAPSAGALGAFVRSPVSRRERARAVRGAWGRFQDDAAVARWSTAQGRPCPTTRGGLLATKARRTISVGGRELTDLVDRRLAASAEVLRVAPHLWRSTVRGGALLFDPRRDQVHALNDTAVLVLDRADRRAGNEVVGAVRRALAPRAALPPSFPEEVEGTLVLLRHHGLLTTGGPRPTPGPGMRRRKEPAPPGPSAAPGGPALVGPAPPGTSTGTVAALGHRIEVVSDEPDLTRFLAEALAPLAVDGPAEHRYLVTTLDAGRERYAVSLDGAPLQVVEGRGLTAGLVLWHVNQLMGTSVPGCLTIHAAAAIRDGILVVLPAGPDHGKSTLVTALVTAGWTYVTDETVAIRLDTMEVRPYPKAIGLDEGSWTVHPQVEPVLDPGPARFRHGRWYVDARRLGPVWAPVDPDRTWPIGALASVRFERGAEAALVALSPLEAASCLASHAFNLGTCGQHGLEVITALAARVPARRLVYGDLRSAVDALDHLVAERPPG